MSHSGSRRAPLDFKKLFYQDLHREFLPDLLKKHGDLLLRRGADGGRVLSVNTEKKVQHFKFSPNETNFFIESKHFSTLEALISHYYETGQTLSGRTHTKLITPIYNTFDMIDSNRLTFREQLGKGNFGEVWKATLQPENETVAIKILSGSASAKDRAECMAEAKLMTLLDHENVVRLKGLSFWHQQQNEPPRLLIILEFCNYGSLDKLLEKNMVEDRGKVRALLDSARGIEYLHKRDVIHRDIASRNCLVVKTDKKFTVKIADFGLSRLAPDHYELATKRRLPVFSTAPDTLEAREWTSASDVWSYGILMHEVYNRGVNPYETHFLGLGTKLKEVMDQLKAGFRLPLPKGMPKELGDLALRCLQKSTLRPSMTEIVAAIKAYHTSQRLP